MRRDQVVRYSFYRLKEKPADRSWLLFEDELMTDESVFASPYPVEGVTKTNCILTADLREVDESQLKSIKGRDGKSYVEIHYDLVVSVKSAIMKFSLEVNGKEMGCVDAKYE